LFFQRISSKLRDIGEKQADGRQSVLGLGTDEKAKDLKAEAEAIFAEDLAGNRAMGKLGAELIPQGARVMTYCNTGALATAGHGTALGVIRSSSKKYFSDRLRNEALPAGRASYRLGMRAGRHPLHSYHRQHGRTPDQPRRVDLVIVGADRIAANGDTANKIGTTRWRCWRAATTSFYVAAPLSTFDPKIPDGSHIPSRKDQRTKSPAIGARAGRRRASRCATPHRCHAGRTGLGPDHRAGGSPAA